MNKFADVMNALFIGLIVVVAMGGLLGWLVMLLWNGCLVPAASGLNEISWLQGWGLMILCGLLFKSTTIKKA